MAHSSIGVLAFLVALAASAEDGKPSDPAAALAENQECLECHSEAELEIELDSGETKNIFVDAQKLASSVHAKLACSDCHTDLKGKSSKHKATAFPTAREFAVNYSDQCKQCHFANYTKTLDSVHHDLIARGKLDAAVCSDCHGSHEVMSAAEPRSKISRTCAGCHEKVSTVYAASVHGKALLNDESPDVPACTDCHRSHDIADPRAGAWKLKTPQMCGSCHTNEKMMSKYGLSTTVLSTYLADFHGSTALLQQGEKGARPMVALCTDCHGVHDITHVNAPGSKVLQANLVKTCQQCHPDATENFPAAWLSHYEPTWEKASLVYGVKKFYAVFIPFIIGGLVLQICLHLWRVVVNR
ncbi:MAG: cytochrome family protein [Myxococcaceae bacterium]|nr:cytochrome family protein [Myxococcaceae bacterium]